MKLCSTIFLKIAVILIGIFTTVLQRLLQNAINTKLEYDIIRLE